MGAVRSESYTSTGAGFTVNSVIEDSVRILFGNFFKIWLIGLVPAALGLDIVANTFLTDSNEPGPLLAAAGFIIVICFSLLATYGLVTAGAVQVLSTGTFGLDQAIRIGFGRVGPLLVVSLLVWLAFAVGLVLLVVPGIFLLCLFAVAAQTTLLERLGPIDSMRRSADLTRGRRWTVLGVVACAIGLNIGLSYGLNMINALGGPDPQFQTYVARETACVVLSAWVNGVMPVFFGVLYYRLRAEKDVVGIGSLARVFD